MAAVARAQGPIQQLAPRVHAPQQTMEKIRQFMCSPAGIGTMFSVLAGVAVAIAWGIPYGLLAGGIGGLLTVLLCKTRQNTPKLDPALQIRPDRPDAAQPIGPERLQLLFQFIRTVNQAILRQNIHFENFNGLFEFLRDRFTDMDYARLTLLSAQPVRFNGRSEGYELIIQSEAPRGWFRVYLPKERFHAFEHAPVQMQRIRHVAPFLDRYHAETNYFSLFGLPFRDTSNLRLALVSMFPRMDLTRVQLESQRPVHFVHDYRPMGGGFIAHTSEYDGLELNFQTPNGPVRFYVSEDGQHVAPARDVRDVVVRN